MKKEYETPKVERMEFDYSKIVTSSDVGRCFISSMTAYWNNTGSSCAVQVAGDN